MLPGSEHQRDGLVHGQFLRVEKDSTAVWRIVLDLDLRHSISSVREGVANASIDVWGAKRNGDSQTALRALSQRRKESGVSPDLRPAKRLATLMSSSRSGQWMPSPPPINRQLSLSGGVPCERRGNQSSGTVIVRPSARSTDNASSLAVTCWAYASLRSVPEVLMPCPHQICSSLFNDGFQSLKLRAGKPTAPLQEYRIEPELSA